MVRGKTRLKKRASPRKKKNLRLKSTSRTKRVRKKPMMYYRDWNGFLDKQVSVRSLLKYSGIVLAFVIVLVIVFLLGRYSAADSGGDSGTTITGSSKQTLKSGASDITVPEPEPEERIVAANLSADDEDDDPVPAEEEETQEYVYDTAPVVGRYAPDPEPEPACNPDDAEFDYDYTNVLIEVSNFQTEKKGDNWAVIESLKLTITNNEECVIINPTQIKMKLNNKGKGATWWDDEVFLPDSFKRMRPGDSVTEVIPVHITYSDIYMEKDFRLHVFDDYGIEMGVFKKYMTLS